VSRYNTSSAYAYDEPDREQQKPQEQEEPRKLKVLKTRRFSPGAAINAGVVLAFLLIIALASLIIYNQAQLNMLMREIDALSTEMHRLESENVQMESILSTMNNDEQLKDKAIELGMQERTEFQTRRVYLYPEDKITRSEKPQQPTVLETARLALASLLGQFQF
jgi:cell division protein FtsL